MVKTNKNIFQTTITTFKKYFDCLPLVGMVVKIKNDMYVEVTKVNQISEEEGIVVTKKLAWYELIGLNKTKSITKIRN